MNFSAITFPGDSIEYIAPTWDEMSQITFLLAQKIKKAGVKADRIITLAKGGWPMTRSLVDFTGVNEVASVGVKFYKKEIGERFEKPVVYQDLPISVKGESVILFDDVADTGKSLEFTKQYLLEAGVKDITIVTLFYKKHSVIKPEFHGPETDAWIVFPYENREAFAVFQEKWIKEGLSIEEIDRRMMKFGAQKEWLAEYHQDLG